MARIRIGISGWRYEPWRRIFYPPDLSQARELEFASQAFSTIEINGSFYSLQTPRSYAAWYDATPPDFMFSVKGPRYVTHILRLKDVRKPLANFFSSGVFNLREKLGPQQAVKDADAWRAPVMSNQPGHQQDTADDEQHTGNGLRRRCLA